ncbi:MAG TPA: OmpA family protein [Sphingomonadaceae bacterium]|nr:OmpA family protein [Sphingomonadaceae bacterium]
MRNLHRLGTASLAAALLATTACTTNPETGERRLSRAAIGALGGTVAGFFAGDLIGGKRDRTEKIVGAGIGAIAGGAVGAYMDRQQRELERQTAGTGIDVIRQGDELVLNMPSGITFASNSFAIQPQFRDTLNQVAQTLKSYEQTFIDVRGHTDSTGGDAINVPLSQNRAQAVANYLVGQGVQSARIETRGYAATQPVADNNTEAGKQANRRVEIKIVPLTDAR